MADAAAPAAEEAAGEDKKEKKDEFHVPLEAIAPIAAPLAGKKLSKKLFKTVKKGELSFPLSPLPFRLTPARPRGDQTNKPAKPSSSSIICSLLVILRARSWPAMV